MKRSAPATLRRQVSKAAQWRPKRHGTSDVDLGRLISPLRYDVLVRAQFFRFLDAHLDLYRTDFPAFAEAAVRQPYFVWFERVAMTRFRPWIAADQQLLRNSYEERLRASHALWTGFRRTGFDPRYPVTLRVAHPNAARTERGVRIERDVYVGDGCHRLAVLIASGETMLPAHLYRVDSAPMRRLPDNTALLAPALELDERRYAEFLSMGYADEPQPDLAALTAHVRSRHPERLAELQDFLAHSAIAPARSS